MFYWGSSHLPWWGILLLQSTHTQKQRVIRLKLSVLIDEMFPWMLQRITSNLLKCLKGVAVGRALAEICQCRPAWPTAAPGTAPAVWWPPAYNEPEVAIRQRRLEMLILSGVGVELTAALSGSNQAQRRCNLGPAAGTSSEDILLQHKIKIVLTSQKLGRGMRRKS